jgi:hypothetical protein
MRATSRRTTDYQDYIDEDTANYQDYADEENEDNNYYPSFKTLTYIYANLVITFEIELLFEGNKSILTSFLICFINIIRHPYMPFRVCVKIKFFRSKLYIRVLMLYLV